MTSCLTGPLAVPLTRKRVSLPAPALATAVTVAGSLLLTGCATLPEGQSAADMRALVAMRAGAAWPAADNGGAPAPVAAGVLTQEDALRLALLNNPRFRVELQELGIAEAELRRAVALPNPRLFGSIRAPSGSGQPNNVEFGLSQDVLEILLQPSRRRLAREEFARRRDEVGQRLLALVSDVKERYVLAVAAGERAALRRRMADAERLSRELAVRFHQAGNTSDATLAAAEARLAGAELAAAQAQAESGRTRAELQRAIAGPGGAAASPAAWTLPERLPGLPAGEPEVAAARQGALAGRLDLAAARSSVVALDAAVTQARRWRWTGGVVTVGVDTERGNDGERVTGPNLTIGLPIFDRGDALIAGLTAKQGQARERVAVLETEIANDATAACEQLTTARVLIKTIEEQLIPARAEAVRRLQLEQNYMLISVFDVLAARQEEFAAQEQLSESRRNYWLARLHLESVMGSGALLPADTGAAPAATPELKSEPAAQPAGHQH